MSNDKMSDELQIAIRRSPEYALALVLAELADLRERVARMEKQSKVQDAYLERIKAANNPAW
jgi:hypothetical protein